MTLVPVTIITGFLGAGKTTLLNRLLSDGSGERIAVIVNEYGEIGIDGQLVVETQENVIELNNGCLCCTVRGDLIAAIGRLLDGRGHIDRIIIETSGLADPAPVIQSFVVDDRLAARLQLDAVVTVTDARHLPRQLEHDEAREQIAFADVVLINKIDLEDELSLEAVELSIRRLNPLAKLHRICEGAIDRARVLDLGAFDLKNLLSIEPDFLSDHEHEHDSSIGCVAIRSPGPVDGGAFERWMARYMQAHGAGLLRVKGIVNMAGEARRYVFHGVHMTLDGRPGRPWRPGESRGSQLVFIGRNLDETLIRTGFLQCHADVPCLA